MKSIVRVFGTAAILAATVIGAPRNNNAGDSLENRWLAEASDDSNSWNHGGQHHNSWNDVSLTNSLVTSSSCIVPSTTTVLSTTTVSVTVYTTVTRQSTRHSHIVKHSTSGSLVFIKNTSTSIPLSTGYLTGTVNSSTTVFALYSNTSTSIPLSTGYSSGTTKSSTPFSISFTNTTKTSIPLSTVYSTGQPSISRPTSAPFANSTTVSPSKTPFNTHKQHHSHHKASITVSSSMIFIAASSTIPTTRSQISTVTTSSHPITATMSGPSAPTSTPLPHDALLCGVHGFPVGDFFLGQLVESKPDVDITLQICYEFCAGIYGIDMGCLSIEFYPEPDTEAPRCNLYSEGVAESIDMVIPEVPNVWYDLGCAVPAS